MTAENTETPGRRRVAEQSVEQSVRLTPRDRKLLDLLQEEFPISTRPFAQLGAKVDLREAEVVARVAAWRQAGIVRRLGPVFEPRRLGYRGVLCAAAVAAERLEQVATAVNRHPGVTHNYLREPRNLREPWPPEAGAARPRASEPAGSERRAFPPGVHPFNLWFTLTAASDAEVERALAGVRADAGLSAGEPAVLPALRFFKIKVEFSLADGEGPISQAPDAGIAGTDAEGGGAAGRTKGWTTSPKPRDWDLIEGLQEELPAVVRPFAALATGLGLSEDALCARINELKEAGLIRRFGATLKHFAVGYGANAMVVWRVPSDKSDKIEEAGRAAAGFAAVSHCYERAVAPGWPYNLYTMIHGKSDDDVFATIGAIARAAGTDDYLPLFTVRELKKERMRYRRPEK